MTFTLQSVSRTSIAARSDVEQTMQGISYSFFYNSTTRHTFPSAEPLMLHLIEAEKHASVGTKLIYSAAHSCRTAQL